MATKTYALAANESIRFRFEVSKSLPGDAVTVRSSNPESAQVILNDTPLPGAVASGRIWGHDVPKSAVAIQGTVTHADKTTSVSVVLLDVAGGDPPPPPAPKPVPPIVATLSLVVPPPPAQPEKT